MVAYYAHSHGNGHLNTAQLFHRKIFSNSIIITSVQSEGDHVVQIENEDTSPEEYSEAIFNLPAYAHYLPKSNRKLLKRAQQILNAVVNYNITVACVDVSVETAILFRVASIPYGYNLLLGQRDDKPHEIAFEAADFLYAFLPGIFFENHKQSYKVKSFYLGFHSRFPFRSSNISNTQLKPKHPQILVICGKGGTIINDNFVERLLIQLPDCEITLTGAVEQLDKKFKERCLGYHTNIEHTIEKSDVIISSCGINLTSEILAIKNKFIAIAEERPYDEQIAMQKTLVKHQLAIAFDLKNVRKCVEQYFELQPPEQLSSWFCNESSLQLFKNKLRTYI